MTRPHCFTFALAVMGLGIFTSMSYATLIIDASTVTGNAQNGTVAAVNMINNSGLSATLAAPGTAVTYPGTFPNQDPDDNHVNGGYSNEFRTGISPTQTVTFTLNQAYDLTGLYIYNYAEIFNSTYYNIRGTQTATLAYSTNNGGSYSTLAGTLTLPEAPLSTTYTGNNISLGTTLAGVTNVKLNLLTNYGDGALVGLGEVRFIGTIPEPATLGVLSCGAFGLLLRRKRA